MKPVARSIGGVFVEGFLVLLPFLISYLLLGGFFDMLLSLTQPIVDVLPESLFSDAVTERMVAAVALVVIIFAAGIAARSRLGRRLGLWIEARVLTRFPPYEILRSFSRRMLGSDRPEQLQPAFLRTGDGNRLVCFIVEDVPQHDSAVIFVPLAPTPGIGTVQITHRSRLEPMEATFGDAVGCLFNWGSGTGRLIDAHLASGRWEVGK